MSDHDSYSDSHSVCLAGHLIALSENSGLGTSLVGNLSTCLVGKMLNERARSPPHPRLLRLRFLLVRMVRFRLYL
jgi:hypothetical protein